MDKSENLLRALLSTPQGARAVGNMDKLKDLAASAEGQALLRQLGGAGGDALKEAARAAAGGDRDSATKLVGALMSTPDGAKLAMTLIGLLG